MQFGFAVPSYGRGADPAVIADLIAAGDELGFDIAWWPDHIAVPDYARDGGHLSPPFLEPLSACAWGIGTTRKLRMGTDVLVAPYRSPLLVSAMAGTLGVLAEDRLVLGVGIGYLRGEFELLGLDYERRAELTEEWLHAVREQPQGFTVVGVGTTPPLWVGGNSLRAQRRAALLGDGWHPLWLSPGDYRAARERIETTRKDAGRLGRFTFSFSAARTELLERVPDQWPESSSMAETGSEFGYAPPPWVDRAGRPGLVGTPDQVVADLRELERAGVDQVTLRFRAALPTTLEQFARQVMCAWSS
jgi:alkanesulfonate monooxygenase SsuD/methylene tetrahydromethanopterin reductase-like flavin-dependent oxidoreductase (luciferase family)